jgi:hypothetical protein
VLRIGQKAIEKQMDDNSAVLRRLLEVERAFPSLVLFRYSKELFSVN